MDTISENMDVDEFGKTVYKRDFTGSYTNPSDWCVKANGGGRVGVKLGYSLGRMGVEWEGVE